MIPLPPADSQRAAALALIPTAIALIASQPPSGAFYTAWVALVPITLWAGAAPRTKRFVGLTFLTMWFVQIASMIWLRHVYPPMGYIGLVLITGYFALYPTLWAYAARRILPGAEQRPLVGRLTEMVALAGLWMILEWVRGHLFTGCPWMPLAATQWEIPPMLALAAYAGPAGPGFIIVLFNLGLARYARWLVARNTTTLRSTGMPMTPLSGFRFCPEFYFGMAPIFLSFFVYMKHVAERRSTDTELFVAGIIQTDFDPNAKWNPGLSRENTAVAVELTRAAANLTEENPVWKQGAKFPPLSILRPDFILWPEAALRYSIDTPGYTDFLTNLASENRVTLLVGAISDGEGKGYYNGIHAVTGDRGLAKDFYAKRHLVPFGEYVPFADVLPLRKVVPIQEDSLRGERIDPLELTLRDGAPIKLGTLVCYEDIFPELARDMALRGADALVVVTNDAWYGKEAGAYQHAATSAVLAASTGLPILRCGNAGWSGVIAPTGRPSPVLDAEGSIYFRGAARVPVRGTPAEKRTPTPYVLHGDIFLIFCAGALGITVVRRRFTRVEPVG